MGTELGLSISFLTISIGALWGIHTFRDNGRTVLTSCVDAARLRFDTALKSAVVTYSNYATEDLDAFAEFESNIESVPKFVTQEMELPLNTRTSLLYWNAQFHSLTLWALVTSVVSIGLHSVAVAAIGSNTEINQLAETLYGGATLGLFICMIVWISFAYYKYERARSLDEDSN